MRLANYVILALVTKWWCVNMWLFLTWREEYQRTHHTTKSSSPHRNDISTTSLRLNCIIYLLVYPSVFDIQMEKCSTGLISWYSMAPWWPHIHQCSGCVMLSTIPRIVRPGIKKWFSQSFVTHTPTWCFIWYDALQTGFKILRHRDIFRYCFMSIQWPLQLKKERNRFTTLLTHWI